MPVTVASLLVKIDGDASGAVRAAAESERALQTASSRAGDFAESVGRSSLKGSAALLALGAGAGKLAIDFESGFAGVIKTVGGTEAQLAQLASGIRSMAKEIPVGTGELNRIAEAAGQLGVKREDILKFTRVVAEIGTATNLAGEQAAAGMARLANITQMPMEQVDRLASTIVALGNAGASTESEILDMALRIAGAGHQVGLTEAQILSFANALSSVGIEAEAGGTAMSRVFVEIDKAVADGGEKLAGFAAVAGMSAAQFKQAWGTDASAATLAFIEGLGGIEASGHNVFTVLEDLELGEIRVRDALLRASGAGDLFRESLELGSEAWKENTALTEEAGRRWETTASKLTLLKNAAFDVGITLGDHLLPIIARVAEVGAAQLPAAFEWMEAEFGPKVAFAAEQLGKLEAPLTFIGEFFRENESAATALANGVGAATVAMLAFAAASLAASLVNPFTLTIVAITTLVGGISYLVLEWDNLRERYVAVEAAHRAGIGVWTALNAAIEGVSDGVREVTDWFERHDTIAKALALTITATLAVALVALVAPTALVVRGAQDVVRNWDSLTNQAAELGQSLAEVGRAFYDLGADLAAWGAEFLRFIDDIFGGVPGEMAELGFNIVQGLWDGISNRWGDFIDWLWERVEDIPGVLKDFLRISSPSDLMADEVGVPIAEGIAVGIERGWPAVDQSISQMGTAMATRLEVMAAYLREYVATLFSGIFNGSESASTFDRIEYVAGGGNPAVLDPFGGGRADTGSSAARTRAPFSWSGGGGGGGGAAAAARSAAEEFADAWLGELERGRLAEAFGETGASLMEQFADSLENPGSAARLPDLIGRLIDEAEEAGVPNARELGQNLADAIAAGLGSGDSGPVRDALSSITAAVKAAGTLTVESFGAAISAKAADRRLLDQIGSGGKSLMDALDKAIAEGGKKNIDRLADIVDGMQTKLSDKASEAQAAYLGTSMMRALEEAIANNGPEAEARLASVLANINEIMKGGAIDIRTGTVIAADAIRELASAFDIDGQVLIDNIQVLIDSGLTNLSGALDQLPEAARKNITALLEILTKGVYDANALINQIGANVPGGPKGGGGSGTGTGSPPATSTSQVMPGETVAEFVRRVTGVDVFGGQGSLFDINGRYMSPADIIAAVTANAAKFARDFLYGGYSTGANPMQSGKVTKDGFVPNPPYDGSHAGGLDYVPYDNYIALLHRGEAVLTAQENRAGRSISVGAIQVTLHVAGSLDREAVPMLTASFREAVREVIEEELTTEAVNWGVMPR